MTVLYVPYLRQRPETNLREIVVFGVENDLEATVLMAILASAWLEHSTNPTPKRALNAIIRLPELGRLPLIPRGDVFGVENDREVPLTPSHRTASVRIGNN